MGWAIMNINIPESAIAHFWEEPPAGSWEFWSFRFPPPCKVGDPLLFRFHGTAIARAIVAKIEKPGESQCDGTGRFRSGWKVFWTPESFVDLRQEPSGADRLTDVMPESGLIS